VTHESPGVNRARAGGPAPGGPQSAVIGSLLPALLDDWRHFFGSSLAGVYLCGSVVAGGFDPLHSDLDLIVVCDQEAADVDLARLDRVHQRFATRHPDWADRMDFVYVGRQTLAMAATGSGTVATISHDEPLHLLPARGWVLTWYPLQQTHTVLLGAELEQLLAPTLRVRRNHRRSTFDDSLLPAVDALIERLTGALREAAGESRWLTKESRA
jgi:hypothetical protein